MEHKFLKCILLIITISTSFTFTSQAKYSRISDIFEFNSSLNTTGDYFINFPLSLNLNVKTNVRSIITCILSFLAAAVSSAGGIGGGGLLLPILTIVAALDFKTASSYTAFMVTGGSIANVAINLFAKRGAKPLIDYDIALISGPFLLVGVSCGVICNKVFPEWLITAFFVFFLAFCTYKTFGSGVKYWKRESESLSRKNDAERKEPLLVKGTEEEDKLVIPWLKIGMLVVVWISFLVLYVLSETHYGQALGIMICFYTSIFFSSATSLGLLVASVVESRASALWLQAKRPSSMSRRAASNRQTNMWILYDIIQIKPCGTMYWIISSTQLPVAIFFTTLILYRRNEEIQQENASRSRFGSCDKLIFPVMALMVGFLGGLFGIGGGMLISPFFLQLGIEPEVTAATCSFMVLFATTMSATQYLLLGMEHIYGAVTYASICFVGSIVGLTLVRKAITKHGRTSLIIFSVGTVMALSTVLMTSFGAMEVWSDYTSGESMGFKKPC